MKQDFEAIIPAVKAVIGGQSVFGGEIVQQRFPSAGQNQEPVSYEGLRYQRKEQEIITQVATANPIGKLLIPCSYLKVRCEIISVRF